MTFKLKYIFLFLFITNIFNSTANDKDKKPFIFNQPKDTVNNIYQELLNDKSDDLMENHPADDIYNNIWTSSRLNPYKISIDSLKDSVRINLAGFCLPCPGYITSNFGPRHYRYHYGTDLELNVGDSIYAAFKGKVRIINFEYRGYGHYVVIRHDNGLETVYAHLSKVLVAPDQTVKAGELIALGGNTGRSTGPHLHFETRYLGNAINPAFLIDFETGKIRKSDYLITKKESFHYQKEAKILRVSAKYYKVRSGDNLGGIASRNGTSVKAICRLNGFRSTKLLQPGQRIRIR